MGQKTLGCWCIHSIMSSLILLGDCIDQLPTLPDESVDAVVTDPPYGLGNHEPTLGEILMYLHGGSLNTGGDFMGNDWEIPSVPVWLEVYRVLKPGGHVLSFGGTRSWDLISLGLRAAGFEKRDTIAEDHPALRWVYGQGFPKSMRISKAIDKMTRGCRQGKPDPESPLHGKYQHRKVQGNTKNDLNGYLKSIGSIEDDYIPLSEEAKKHAGWGTALKPSWEPILVFRKPLEGTVVSNVLKHGTGGINIDGCRVGTEIRRNQQKVPAENLNKLSRPDGKDSEDAKSLGAYGVGAKQASGGFREVSGRWPPNMALTHHPDCKKVRGYSEGGTEAIEAWECVEGCPVKVLDEQSGELTSGRLDRSKITAENKIYGKSPHKRTGVYEQDAGGASRFFPSFEGQEPVDVPFRYVAKPSKAETTLDGEITNDHPTKKPLELMRWLVRLVTPPGGVVLDPYCGSGTTLHAACEEGMGYVGIEKYAHIHDIATARMRVVEQQMAEKEHQYAAFDLAMSLGDEEDE